MAQQVDITPASNTLLKIHFHGPVGQSAAHCTNPSDFPNAAPSAALPAGGKAVGVKIAQTSGGPRFAKPELVQLGRNHHIWTARPWGIGCGDLNVPRRSSRLARVLGVNVAPRLSPLI